MEAAAYHHSRVEGRQRSMSDEHKSYLQEGVFIHLFSSIAGEDKIIGGTLSISKEGNVWNIKWVPTVQEETGRDDIQFLQSNSNAVLGDSSKGTTTEGGDSEESATSQQQENSSNENNWWTVVAGEQKPEQHQEDVLSINEEQQSKNPFAFRFAVPITEVKRMKKSSKDYGWKYIIFELRDGATLPALHFHADGYKQFMLALKYHITRLPSRDGNRWYDVTPINHGALTMSFDELNIFSEPSNSSTSQFSANNILQDPFGSAYSGFTKVTNFLTDMINPVENHPYRRPDKEQGQVLDAYPVEENDDDDDFIGSGRYQITKNAEENVNGFELITCAQLKPRVDPVRVGPLTEVEWNEAKDDEGRITNPDEVNQRIFRGCVHPSIRPEVWRYQLGLYEWSKTKKENEEKRTEKENDYYRMKNQWKTMSTDQLSRFTELSTRRSLIEKDVARTDRKRPFYSDPHGWGLQRLEDILTTYCMYDFDLGYVQGMNDLLAILLEVIQDEADAFWCFVGYMDIVHDNFVVTQRATRRQLRDLRILIEFFDPRLWDHLHEKSSSDLFFCFRWVLIRFKREFSYEDIQKLWEVLWTKLPCENFHLIFILALLDTERQFLTDEDCGFTEILKHINEMADRIDLESTLSRAEGIYDQLVSCPDSSSGVKSILGIS